MSTLKAAIIIFFAWMDNQKNRIEQWNVEKFVLQSTPKIYIINFSPSGSVLRLIL